jgi:hypothetical protein
MSIRPCFILTRDTINTAVIKSMQSFTHGPNGRIGFCVLVQMQLLHVQLILFPSQILTYLNEVQAVAIVELIVELFPQSIPVKIREQVLYGYLPKWESHNQI